MLALFFALFYEFFLEGIFFVFFRFLEDFGRVLEAKMEVQIDFGEVFV